MAPDTLQSRVSESRTAHETKNLMASAAKYDKYREAVLRAGGEPVEVSLVLSADKLRQLASTLDAVVLTGSPADVNPSLYGSCAKSCVRRS